MRKRHKKKLLKKIRSVSATYPLWIADKLSNEAFTIEDAVAIYNQIHEKVLENIENGGVARFEVKNG